MKSRVIVVLGSHRSGTSCLTGILKEAGVFLGNVSLKDPHNFKGNHENRRIMELHDQVLADNGGTWADPPENITWSNHHKNRRSEILAEYEGQRLWGFKDPRTLIMLGSWLEVIPDADFIATFRHPEPASRSLHKATGVSLDKCFQVWKHRNLKLIEYHDRYKFPIVCFDWDPARYKSNVAKIISGFTNNIKPEKIAFFDSELKHREYNSGDTVAYPSELDDIYSELHSRSSHCIS